MIKHTGTYKYINEHQNILTYCITQVFIYIINVFYDKYLNFLFILKLIKN
jgi:hypothetical protein